MALHAQMARTQKRRANRSEDPSVSGFTRFRMHQDSNSQFETLPIPLRTKADSSGSPGTSGEPLLHGHRKQQEVDGEIVGGGSLKQQIH